MEGVHRMCRGCMEGIWEVRRECMEGVQRVVVGTCSQLKTS